MTHANTVEAPIALEIEAEVTIAATPEQVWSALTDGIGEWWPHSFSDSPARIALEPRIGGRFFESFSDDDGSGALYALVTYIEPKRILRISGPMGMAGARQYVKTYRLEATAGGTRVRTSASMLGDISEETRESYRAGGDQVLRALKEHVERRAGTA